MTVGRGLQDGFVVATLKESFTSCESQVDPSLMAELNNFAYIEQIKDRLLKEAQVVSIYFTDILLILRSVVFQNKHPIRDRLIIETKQKNDTFLISNDV